MLVLSELLSVPHKKKGGLQILDWVVWLFSFLGVLGLIFLLFYALKKLNKSVNISSGSKLRVIDRVNLGKDGMLLVVSVDKKLMLIGATTQRVEKLCDLETTEEEYLSGNSGQDFKTVLSSVIWKKSSAEFGQKNGGEDTKSDFSSRNDGSVDFGENNDNSSVQDDEIRH